MSTLSVASAPASAGAIHATSGFYAINLKAGRYDVTPSGGPIIASRSRSSWAPGVSSIRAERHMQLVNRAARERRRWGRRLLRDAVGRFDLCSPTTGGSGGAAFLEPMHQRIVRRTAAAAMAAIVVALGACGTYPANPTTTSTTTTTTVPLLCRVHHCANSAAVQRVLTAAEHGALVPLVATYRFIGAKSAPLTFVYATAPGKSVLSQFPPAAEYLYRAQADGVRYEFISNHSGYFECLTPQARLDWTCHGPIPLGDPGLGRGATVGAYDVGVDLLDYLGPPPGPDPVTSRVLNGFPLSCVSYTQGKYPDTWTWCITGQGVLGYLSGPSFLRGIELVHLGFKVSNNEFSLPAKPTKWQQFEAWKNNALLPPGLVGSPAHG